MEVLPVPAAAGVTSTLGSVYTTVATTTGSAFLGYVIVSIIVVGLCFLLWTIGNWLFNLFKDPKEEEDKEINYIDAVGQPIPLAK